jgi:hypothetical protein
MAGEEPVGDLVEDVPTLAAEVVEAVTDLVNEVAEGRGEVATCISLEVAPLALLGIELWAVAGEPDDVQPVGPLGQGGPTRAAGVAGAVVEDEVDFLAGRDVPPFECLEVASEGCRVLRRLEHLDPPPTERFDAAKDGHPPVGPDGRHGRLLATSMPDPTQVGVRLDMGLILVMQLVPVRLGGYLFPPPPSVRLCTRQLRRHPASV